MLKILFLILLFPIIYAISDTYNVNRCYNIDQTKKGQRPKE